MSTPVLDTCVAVFEQETIRAVYNWQFMHSLGLWSRLVSQLHHNETLQPLVYPLVEVTLGTIK